MQDRWGSEKVMNVKKQKKYLICLIYIFFSAIELYISFNKNIILCFATDGFQTTELAYKHRCFAKIFSKKKMELFLSFDHMPWKVLVKKFNIVDLQAYNPSI